MRFCTILYLTVLLKALAHKTRSYQSQQATVKGCKLLKRNNPPFSQRTENPSITQLISRASAPAYYLGGPPATVPQHSNHGLQQPTLPHIQTHTHTRAAGDATPHHHHNATMRSRRTYPTSSRSDQDRRAADMPTRRCHHSRAQVARLKTSSIATPPHPIPV